ncbi:MAG: thiamine-phosphate kinase [Alphaproteobacteria bacterium]|nr:thiamine-phosphate kinase [Alphaproteobacteria bacterium]
MASSQSAEDRLIARHFKPLATHPGAFGLVDDAAVLTPPPGHELVLKTDGIVGGVHFFLDDPPETVAQKALRVNLSDLASKGARPAGFLLTLALPAPIDDRWLSRFARGLGADARRYGCPLFGGDTVHTPGPVTISVAAFGTVPKGTMVRRGGARAGDRIFVTGTIGDAALGVRVRMDKKLARRWTLDAAMRRHLETRYLVPQPRNALAEALRRHANGGMDVSDGLAGDLAKLCRASGVGAEVDATLVPLSKAARRALKAAPPLIEPILTGGDDFEILATIPARKVASFRAAAKRAGVAVTEIGRIVVGKSTRFRSADGRTMTFARASYSHF